MSNEINDNFPQGLPDDARVLLNNVLLEMIKGSLRIKNNGTFPGIICLCGSTKFKEQFITANFVYTMCGYIVLSVGFFTHADKDKHEVSLQEKELLDELHKRKIDLADEVVVICPGGYIGDSTKSEIEYAIKLGKKITYLERIDD